MPRGVSEADDSVGGPARAADGRRAGAEPATHPRRRLRAAPAGGATGRALPRTGLATPGPSGPAHQVREARP
ncbi:hypothetical protein FAGKG844_780006 [Frankia sp. AgKG'84/4]